VEAMDEANNEEAKEELEETEHLLQKTHKAIEDLEKF